MKSEGGHTFKVITVFSCTLFVMFLLVASLCFLPVLATSNVITVPDQYLSIQEAVNHSRSGDTIFVKSGTYTENVVVNKDGLKLVGENKETTVIDGNGTGTVVYVEANNSEVSYFTIQNSGFSLTDSGIYLNNSFNTLVSNNKVCNNNLGIYLSSSSNCILQNNNMTGNQYNFGVSGRSVTEFIHSIDSSNVVDGKTVVYWVNEANRKVPDNAGYVAVINSTKVNVENVKLTNNWQSILFAYTADSNVKNVTLTSNMDALWLIGCSDCSVYENNVQENNWGGIAIVNSNFCTFERNNITENKGYGVFLSDSSDNLFYHNNFNNTNQVWLFGVNSNTWDAGAHAGGNYWSDYKGGDSDSNGVGDVPYVIASDNKDGYPLTFPYTVLAEEPTGNLVLYVIAGIVIIAIVAVVCATVLRNRKRGT